MAGNTTDNSSALKQAEVWSMLLKDVLKDELSAMNYVKMVESFTGDTLNIPTINDIAFAETYTEDAPISYQPMESGNFEFTITEYLQSGHYITNKLKQDSYKANELIAKFVPAESRAIMAKIEADIMNLSSKQTAGDYNRINGVPHRFCAGGTSQVAALEDMQKATYALKKANVPIGANKVALVDPSYAYELQRLVASNNVSNNPRWEGIVASGGLTDATFALNVDGWDIYMSNYLPTVTETINGKTVTAGKANMFFINQPDIQPFLFGWRQEPKVDGEYCKDRQRDEYVTTARYGTALYRPENLVTILSKADGITF